MSRQSGLCITPNGDKLPRLHHLEQGHQERLAGFSPRTSMAAVGQRVVRLMWMERKHIPEQNGPSDLGDHLPDDRSRTFRYDRATRSPLKRDAAEELRHLRKMDFVSERNPGPPAATIAKIAGNPKRIDAALPRRPSESALKVGAAALGCIGPVVNRAEIGIGIEDAGELIIGESSYEFGGRHVRHLRDGQLAAKHVDMDQGAPLLLQITKGGVALQNRLFP